MEYAAAAAGLGEIGYHGMFMTREFGIRQALGLLVTDMEIEPSRSASPADICDDCMACVKECPLGAISAEETAAVEAARAAATLARSPELVSGTDRALLPLGIEASYWLDLRDYDPAATAAKQDVSFLFLQGGRDYQVPPSELELWKSALGERASYRLYPELNHLFIAGEGRPTNEEYLRPGTVDARVAADIAGWIAEQD